MAIKDRETGRVINKDFMAVALGGDMNCYGVARSYYEAYGLRTVMLGRVPVFPSADSTLYEDRFYDADLLDEVGAIGIMRDCMTTAVEDEASYKRAYYKIKEFYRANKPKISQCKTDTARNEFAKRLQVVEGYIYQLERELF